MRLDLLCIVRDRSSRFAWVSSDRGLDHSYELPFCGFGMLDSLGRTNGFIQDEFHAVHLDLGYGSFDLQLSGHFCLFYRNRITFLFGENQTDLNYFAKVAHVLCFEQMCPADGGQTNRCEYNPHLRAYLKREWIFVLLPNNQMMYRTDENLARLFSNEISRFEDSLKFAIK